MFLVYVLKKIQKSILLLKTLYKDMSEFKGDC